MRLGLCGYAQVGKDTICRTLGLLRYGFADALKYNLQEALAQMCLFMDREQDKKKARDVLVAYGRLGRSVDPDYWVKRLQIPRHAEDWAVTDARYGNEVKYLMMQRALVIRIHRDGYGPANDEEARSFDEIERMYPDMISIGNNSTPERAAEDVRRAWENFISVHSLRRSCSTAAPIRR